MTTFIRLEEVRRKTGISRSLIYKKIAEGTFPKQIHLGARAVGWIDQEIADWITEQISSSRNQSDGDSAHSGNFRKLENPTKPRIGNAHDPIKVNGIPQHTAQGREGVL